MPYIDQTARARIDAGEDPRTVGELNYKITRIVHNFLRVHGISYTNFNGVVGVLECAKMELYRRFVVPYEDQKIADNSDVKL